MAGLHNLNLMAGQKKFGAIPKSKNDMFLIIQWGIDQVNKQTAQNVGFRGPNSNLVQATFGPRAVCCACLLCGLLFLSDLFRLQTRDK